MVFVTGATGFIGSHLLYHLINGGNKVVALKRSSSDLQYVKCVFRFYTRDYETHFRKIDWVDGDITEYDTLLEVMRRADEVYHGAAMVSFDPADKYKMFDINIVGTANVVNAALQNGVGKLACISSVAALDPAREDQVVTEEFFGNFPQRYSNYAESKFHSELEVWRGVEEGLNAVVVNPSIVLGPCIPLKGPGNFFKVIKKGIGFYPGGMTGFVDVRDVCGILINLMQRDIMNERFIVSEGNHTYKELFQLIAEAFQSKMPRRELKPFVTDIAWKLERFRSKLLLQKPRITKELHQSAHRRVRFSNDKVKNRLNHQFIPLHQTIADTVNSLDI
ncbi:MAG: SDR family NAD(P)-dependent oxidoreductase [Bacteroidales bacterium]|nr:SDR family NAD(P)-dependent oxidoreductase [Bacteroidales bacterium]